MLDNTQVGLGHNDRVIANLFVADGTDFDPQTLAMLQAFYSRSTKSIAERVEGLDADQVRESLHKFFVGYGHRSIGQCSNFTVFLEDVSILAAKFIQHHPLYNGQETSTRYFDFRFRPMVLPQSDEQYERYMRTLYATLLKAATDAYTKQAADDGHELDANMVRTCKAKAFDLARCVLVAGHTTKLSWTTNYDQAAEQLAYLINSPIDELRKIGRKLAVQLHNKYPQAFAAPETLVDPRQADVLSNNMFDETGDFLTSMSAYDQQISGWTFHAGQRIDANLDSLLRTRVRSERMPRSFARYGRFDFAFNIDFGSWRDLHRHRNGDVYFPSYTGIEPLKMHPWYLQEIERLGIGNAPIFDGETIRSAIDKVYTELLPYVIKNVLHSMSSREQPHTIARHDHRSELMYYVPIGTEVRAFMTYDLPQAVYVSEMRTARTVHPTARIAAHFMADVVRRTFPQIELFTDDFDSAKLSPKRGQQTILERV